MMSCRGAKLPKMPNLIKFKGSNFQERATVMWYDQKVPDFYQARTCWQSIMTVIAILTLNLSFFSKLKAKESMARSP